MCVWDVPINDNIQYLLIAKDTNEETKGHLEHIHARLWRYVITGLEGVCVPSLPLQVPASSDTVEE